MAEEWFVGWVKMHRKGELSPVWDDHNAWRLLQWLVWRAAPWERESRSGGRVMVVRRGQVFASLPEMARGVGLTEKQVRRALDFLQQKKTISRDSENRSLIVVVNFQQYQGGDYDDAPPMESEGEFSSENEGQEKGQVESRKKGRVETCANSLYRNRKTIAAYEARADGNREKGQAKGQTINKDKEDKELIPPTPFKKGGCDFSSSLLAGSDEERIAAVLAMWRHEWIAAGRAYQDGLVNRRDRNGAKKIIKEHIGVAGMTVHQLREGMKCIIQKILNDAQYEKCDLLTFANNPNNYFRSLPIEKPKRVKVRWFMVCDVCGYECATDFVPAPASPPSSTECARGAMWSGGGCQGVMYPEREERVEA